MRIAVADKAQAWSAVAGIDTGSKPHLAHAALHLVGVVPVALRQWLKLAPQLDHVAVAILPIFEESEIGDDLVEANMQILCPRGSCGFHGCNIGAFGERVEVSMTPAKGRATAFCARPRQAACRNLLLRCDRCLLFKSRPRAVRSKLASGHSGSTYFVNGRLRRLPARRSPAQ